MPSNNPNALNAAGLTPEQSKTLSERTPKPDEQVILTAIKELYGCKAKESSYSVYAEDAVFHDPIGVAKGVANVRGQFNGLAKIFAKADIPKFRVLETPSTVPQSTILIDQDVVYYRDASKEPTKTVNSLLTIERNPAGAIVKHTEEWDHRHEPDSNDGFLGTLNEWRKTATVTVSNMFTPKDAPGGQ